MGLVNEQVRKKINYGINSELCLVIISLNPYNELNDPKSMILDDSFIANNLDHMCFGEDDSGNILHWTEAYINSLGKFHLITGNYYY